MGWLEETGTIVKTEGHEKFKGNMGNGNGVDFLKFMETESSYRRWAANATYPLFYTCCLVDRYVIALRLVQTCSFVVHRNWQFRGRRWTNRKQFAGPGSNVIGVSVNGFAVAPSHLFGLAVPRCCFESSLYQHLRLLTTIFFHGSLFFSVLQLFGAFDFCLHDL